MTFSLPSLGAFLRDLLTVGRETEPAGYSRPYPVSYR